MKTKETEQNIHLLSADDLLPAYGLLLVVGGWQNTNTVVKK